MKDLKNSTVMVIGGAGLIGSHLVEELLKEPVAKIIIYDNFCRGTMDNLKEALKDKRVEIYPDGGDIMQTDILAGAMKGVDYVFHLAALWLLQCYEYPRSAFKVNIEGTFNVMEACVRNKVKKLVYSSSASVYGDAVELPMTEEHPYNNRTFYGATKIACEHMLRAYNERYDLDYAGLRYMNVYGPRQDYKGAYIAVMMKILDRIEEGKSPIVYGDGSQSYDFIYVKDVAKANICAMKSDALDAFYNVGTGIKTSIKELTELLLRLSGSDLKIKYEPEGQTFVTNRIGSTEKAEQEIGFKAAVPIEEGMKALIEWRRRDQKAVEERRGKQ
ncbi:NAD-dependent dehydratase [Candidatus Atribacteria bacterium HGW-Atribacteria-1]|nr:MAG: NAD-dependent dehydratase [Candidatus Atribacteria bacterium HGW-Atribacteria-1]